MNGAHDLGGMHGFAAIDIESGETLFQDRWEARVFALCLACGFLGQWNIDQSRYARERMEPGEYLQSRYYQHWLHGLEQLLLESGLIALDELPYTNSKPAAAAPKEGETSNKTPLPATAIPAEKIAAILSRGGPADYPAQHPAKFSIDEEVRVLQNHPKGHTRAPRFIRGQHGLITQYRGSYLLPDDHSLPHPCKTPAHLYSVRFSAQDLWGVQIAEVNSAVYVDVFEPYLDTIAC